MLLPLSRSTYKRGDLPESPLRNGYFETAPLNQESQSSLRRRAGHVAHGTAGAGPTRGVYRQDGAIGGLAIVVSGTAVYSVTTGGTATLITGTISGTDRVSMAGSAAKVLISNGVALYETDGATMSQVTLPDTFAPGDVKFINGRFLVTKLNTHRYYWSGVSNTTFDALDYASAEMAPDALIGLGIATDEVWFLGVSSVEVGQPTADPDAPFVRVQGRAYDMGCANRHTIATAANGVAWVGADNKVYHAAGELNVISHSGIEESLRKGVAADLRAWSYKADGHEFYVLTITNYTFAYDFATKLWTEFTSYGKANYRGHLGYPLGSGQYVAADAYDGSLWRIDPTVRMDGTDPISFEFGAWVEAKAPVRCNNVILDCTVGSSALGSDPMIAMRCADDRGYVYGDWMLEPLGRQGEFGEPVVWRRLGQIRRPGRAFEFRITDDVDVTVRKAQMNEPV